MTETNYFVMRKDSTGTQRNAWTSPTTGEVFCGVCLRGQVEARVGARCGVCEGEVVQQLVATQGGVSRPAFAALRAEKQRRDAERAAAVARAGNLLTMRAS
ncbi:MAG TPA: hypothetical protein VGU46_10415 [Acidobacteriaceae bacterium]|nr:hypothetical protein [Acidobacteriaceae bacterium]